MGVIDNIPCPADHQRHDPINTEYNNNKTISSLSTRPPKKLRAMHIHILSPRRPAGDYVPVAFAQLGQGDRARARLRKVVVVLVDDHLLLGRQHWSTGRVCRHWRLIELLRLL